MRTATPLRVGGGWRDNRVRNRLGLRLLATTAPERAEHAAAVAAVRSKPACALGHFGTTSARRASAATAARWATARTVSVAEGHPGVHGRRRSLGLDRLSCAAARPARSRRASRPGPGAGSPGPAGGAVPARTQRAAARPATPAPGPTRPRQPGRAPRAAAGRVSGRARARTAPGPRGTGARRQDSGALPTSKTRCRRAARQCRGTGDQAPVFADAYAERGRRPRRRGDAAGSVGDAGSAALGRRPRRPSAALAAGAPTTWKYSASAVACRLHLSR